MTAKPDITEYISRRIDPWKCGILYEKWRRTDATTGTTQQELDAYLREQERKADQKRRKGVK